MIKLNLDTEIKDVVYEPQLSWNERRFVFRINEGGYFYGVEINYVINAVPIAKVDYRIYGTVYVI